ncbi:nucleoside/nucleotide kinase family protein [Phaeobacter sp. HF9A]|uniref:nucleoside/nucleotide kinase family protein n=1 Tax=Phaeobacter sp. HF9A TaxID=2721561 RepID=UPI0014315DB9|nr:nucleoside/nucleotide kinase family protein [Phaeobacter sp. HF9A]NIZ12759.1 nucleoside/nucleotide kinase family protein [Phaeobacter sp. HF9A]
MSGARIESLCDGVLDRLDLSRKGRLCGAPGAGKSTLSAPLAAALSARGVAAEVVPMDGFHLENCLLERRGLLARKGAPESFDLNGFSRLCAALRTEDHVVYPLFDRARDIAIAGAAEVGPQCRIAIVEGNYLLLDEPGWRELAPLWDVAIRLDVPLAELEARLVQRWLDHGLSQPEAEARARGNDLANAERIAAAQLPADLVWTL